MREVRHRGPKRERGLLPVLGFKRWRYRRFALQGNKTDSRDERRTTVGDA